MNAPGALAKYLQMYRTKNQGVNPKKIVVTPLAALALHLKGRVLPYVNGVPIEVASFQSSRVAKQGPNLGIFFQEPHGLAACELL